MDGLEGDDEEGVEGAAAAGAVEVLVEAASCVWEEAASGGAGTQPVEERTAVFLIALKSAT